MRFSPRWRAQASTASPPASASPGNTRTPPPVRASREPARAYLAVARAEPASNRVLFETGLSEAAREQTPAAERAFDVLQKAPPALCRQLPESERPPVKLMACIS